MKNHPYKVISGKENAQTLPLWQLIFYMFLSQEEEREKKNIDEPTYYETQNDIVNAIKQRYGQEAKNRFENLKQGTISKAFKELSAPFQYRNNIYVIQKLPIKNRSLADKKRNGYQLKAIKVNTLELLWNHEREKLISAGMLESNQICIVSPYMYIFKIKRPIVRFSKKVLSQMSEEEYKAKKESRESELFIQRVKKVKQHFRVMIEAPTLFDVSAVGRKIIVMLNPTKNSTKIYAPLFNNFFDDTIE